MERSFQISDEEREKVVNGAKQAVEICTAVEQGEDVVIVQDDSSREMARFLSNQVEALGANLTVVNIGEFGKRPLNTEQGAQLVRQVSGADVAFVCTSYYHGEFASFLKPVTDLTDREQLRLALMFDLGLDIRMMTQGMNADYAIIKEFTYKVLSVLEGARHVRVTNRRGTDFIADLGYNWVPYDGFPIPGKWVNLPDGEILTAPRNVNGKIVIDGVVEEFDNPKFGLLKDNPIEMEVVNGRVVLESVNCINEELRRFVCRNLVIDENANRIGEWAIGTNIFLTELIGNLTQDEKFPSIHIAWGDPYGGKTGADWTSIQHMDAVMLDTTVDVDGQRIMENGKYLL